MPFETASPIDAGGLSPRVDVAPETAGPDFLSESVPAAFRQQNTIGSAIAAMRGSLPQQSGEADAGYDPFADIAGYEDHARSFIGADTPADVRRIKSQIERERRDRQTLSESGAAGFVAQLGAGIADPINLIPIGGTVYRAGRLGASVAESAARVGGAGLIATTAQEALLQASQETRTAEESAAAIGLGTVLAGALGGAAPLLRAGINGVRGAKSIAELEGKFGREAENVIPFTAPPEGSAFVARDAQEAITDGPGMVGAPAGAAAVRASTLEEETLKSAFGLERVLGGVDPLLRTIQSPSVVTRRTIQDLAETPMLVAKNADGIASAQAVETRVKMAHAPLADALETMDDLYARYRAGQPSGAGRLSEKAFFEEVGRSARRGDAHGIPEVAESARVMREKVFNPLKNAAIEQGLLPEDVSVNTAISYLTRVYNEAKIIGRRPEFEGRLTAWLTRYRDDVGHRMEESQGELGKHQADIDKILTKLAALGNDDAAGRARGKALTQDLAKARVREERALKRYEADRAFAGLEDVELRDIARQITDTLVSHPPGRLPYEVVPLARGPLRERTLLIPDYEIEDFLENDIRTVGRIYTRTMAPDVELTRAFGRADMRDQIERIREDYARLRAGVTDEKALGKLNSRMEGDIRDLEAVRDRLRGTYGMPSDPTSMVVRTGRAVRQINFLRLLGGMTLSSIPDMARPVMVHGVMRVIGDGVRPLVANLKGWKLAAEEAKLAGTALDMALDTRAMAMADVFDDYGRLSKFERGLSAATQKFGLVSLMSPWNTFWKQFTGVISQTRMLQAIENYAALTPGARELENLAFLGIDQNAAQRIAGQFRQHGVKQPGGAWWANTREWTDPEATEAFRSAMVKDIDRTLVTPGAADRPLWMSSELGKAVGQFKSFSMASVQRTAIAGLQQRDAAVLNGSLLSITLGMMSFSLYQVATGKPMADLTPEKMIAEGADRSGLFFWLSDISQVGGKWMGFGSTSRWASRDVVDALAGPSVGLARDIVQTTGDAVRADWKATDTRAVRRLIPMQNLFYLRRVFDAAEEGINESMDVPDRKRS